MERALRSGALVQTVGEEVKSALADGQALQGV